MSFNLDGPVLLAGAGKMGAAMLSGWLARGLDPSNVIIQEPNIAGEAAELAKRHNIAVYPSVPALPAPPAVIVVKVQPGTSKWAVTLQSSMFLRLCWSPSVITFTPAFETL